MKVALLSEKWCDLEPKFGITSGNSNLHGSLLSSGFNDVISFHYDEYLLTHGQPIDNFLVDWAQREKPDFLVASYFPIPNEPRNVSIETFQNIKQMGVPIIFIWFDAIHPHIRDLAVSMSPCSTLGVFIDGSVSPNDNFLSMWSPHDERIFRNPKLDRNIEVTFCGSTNQYAERRRYLAHLSQNKVPVTVSGGQREHALPIEEYANILQRAKISINFSNKSSGIPQANGRIYESLLCGAFLLEQNAAPITRWLEPMVHYVPFNNEIDLVNKINYYLTNDDEREQIAYNGCEKMKNCYNSSLWWQQVFEKARILC